MPVNLHLSIKPGASVKTSTNMTPEELRKHVWDDGGIARTGVVKIPVLPNPGNKAETFYCLRADVISLLIIEPETPEEKKRIIPAELVPPKDIRQPGA